MRAAAVQHVPQRTLLLLLIALSGAAWSPRLAASLPAWGTATSSQEEDVAGPIVKQHHAAELPGGTATGAVANHADAATAAEGGSASINATAANATAEPEKHGTIAEILDKALQEEFKEETDEQATGSSSNFNATMKSDEVRMRWGKGRKLVAQCPAGSGEACVLWGEGGTGGVCVRGGGETDRRLKDGPLRQAGGFVQIEEML
jgi:hypothetical protein